MNKISGTTILYSALFFGMASALSSEAEAQTKPSSVSSIASVSEGLGESLDKLVIKHAQSRNLTLANNTKTEYDVHSFGNYYDVGDILVIDESSSYFEIKIKPLPFLGTTNYSFLKIDDLTYIETQDDEKFIYEFQKQNGTWKLIDYIGDDSEKKALIGETFSGMPFVDLVIQGVSGNLIDPVEIFIQGRRYLIDFPEFERVELSYGNSLKVEYDLLRFNVDGFLRWEKGKWASYKDDEDVPFGGVVVAFLEDRIVAVVGNTKKDIFFFKDVPVKVYVTEKLQND